MKIISTFTHGIIDYAVGLLLIAAPWLFGFADGTAAQWVPVVLGLAVFGLSLMTAYEWSLVKLIPMQLHLVADALQALLLIASPWLFGFADRVYLPHLIVGIAELGVVALSKTRSTWQGGIVKT